jgi:hypothetical protein
MSNTSRVAKELFEGEHYLGKPADPDDLLIQRRIRLVREIPGFNGNTLLTLASEFKHCTGLEYETAHREPFDRLKEKLHAENAEFREWDISKEAYPAKFDRLISFEVIEHLPSESNLVNYRDSLNPGALAAISVPNKWWIFETHGAKLPLLPWNRVPFFSWLPRFIHERFAHARIYTKSRIKTLLEKYGFEVLRMQYVTAPMDVVKWSPLQKFLRGTLFRRDTTTVPFKAVSIFIVARRK